MSCVSRKDNIETTQKDILLEYLKIEIIWKMLRELFQRIVRNYLITDGVERELFWILVLLRWFLTILVIIFGFWTLSFIAQDILYFVHIYQKGLPENRILNHHSMEFNTIAIIRTLLIGYGNITDGYVSTITLFKYFGIYSSTDFMDMVDHWTSVPTKH